MEEEEDVIRDKPTLEEVLESRGSSKYKEVMALHGRIARSLIREEHSDIEAGYIMMVSHKLSRLSCGYGDDYDNLIDIAGYSTLQAEVL